MPDFASVSGNGVRDSLCIAEESHCTLFAVADGRTLPDMAKLVLDTMEEGFRQTSKVTASTMPILFEEANRRLISFQKENFLDGGCVAAVLLTDGEVALLAHIGDCRVYQLQDGLLYEITPDHSEAYSRYEAGDIRYPKIRKERTRHHLYRMMGREQVCEPTFSSALKVKKNDCFLICTDGFWSQIHERQIEKALRRTKNPAEWLARMEQIVKKNCQKRKHAGQPDDYSAIAIQI